LLGSDGVTSERLFKALVSAYGDDGGRQPKIRTNGNVEAVTLTSEEDEGRFLLLTAKCKLSFRTRQTDQSYRNNGLAVVPI
jgi:cytochrome c peroxidase